MEISESELAGRGFRQRKSRTDPLCCPLCGVTLRPNEIDQHFALEVERLDRILKPKRNVPFDGCSGGSGSSNSNGVGPSGSYGMPEQQLSNGHKVDEMVSNAPDECWGTYQKIKNNRQARLKLKTRKRKAEDNLCPICNKVTMEDITLHVESCLRKSETNGNGKKSGHTNGSDEDDDDDDASIDVEGESFEVYEWAGQTRVRASAMLPSGSLANVGIRITNAEDTDDELNVDGDESQIYGPPQYSERDVIVPSDNKGTLRDLVIANEPQTVKPRESPGEGTSRAQPSGGSCSYHTPVPLAEDCSPSNANQVLESLKAKVREYEGYIRNRPKCLICMDDFRKPVVSVCCWHVYCEECWLHTLGAKKLCPQCSMITSPIDLRRIYL